MPWPYRYFQDPICDPPYHGDGSDFCITLLYRIRSFAVLMFQLVYGLPHAVPSLFFVVNTSASAIAQVSFYAYYCVVRTWDQVIVPSFDCQSSLFLSP